MKTQICRVLMSFLFVLSSPLLLQAQGSSTPGLSEDDKEFMQEAAMGGMTEVALGKLAAEKGSTDQVRAFGKEMVRDHGKINADMEALAKKKGVTLPSSLDKKHQGKVDKLSKLSGKEFDAAYLEAMRKMHKDDLEEFEEANEETKDPDLKAALAKAIPVIKGHMEHLKTIQTQ